MDMLEVVYLPVGELKTYERNARKHTERDLATIVESIKEFGFNDPIGIWGKDNIIVEGHGRLLAAKQLGMTDVPCIRLDELTDEQRRAYALAHNKTAEMSSWLDDILKFELAGIDEIDMAKFGFEPDDEKDKQVKPEVEFTECLGEENNYIVLQFRNDIDWLNACSVFDIKEKKALSTRKDGKLTDKMTRIGVGRVLDGAEAIKRLIGG